MASGGTDTSTQTDLPPPPYSRTCSFAASILPEYSCSILLETTALLKPELSAPWRASAHRSWRCIHSKLEGTRWMVASSRETTSLGLQGAEVGLATDYHRRSHVIRVRAEGWQFLLALPSMAACIEWIEKLNEAITLSPPLENRIEPKYPYPTKRQNQITLYSLSDDLWCQWREQWRSKSHSQLWLQASLQDQACVGSPEANNTCQRVQNQFEQALDSGRSSTETDISYADVSFNQETVAPDIDPVETANQESLETVKGCGRDEIGTSTSTPATRSVDQLLYGARWNKDWNQSPRTAELAKSCKPSVHTPFCMCSQCGTR